MPSSQSVHRRGFSLIELVIVIVIIGIIAAIAIPRMSRGAEGANDSSLSGNLAVLRNSIDLYYTEHEGKYPTAAAVTNQLLTYTDIDGSPNPTKTGNFIFGPYLRAIPAMPIPGTQGKGQTGIAAAAGAGVGWVYDDGTGTITCNTGTTADAKGKLYTAY